MAFQVTLLSEAFATGRAAVRSLSSVDASVGFEVAQLSKAATAERTAERPLASVSLQVGLQVAGVRKALAALATTQEVPGASMRVWMGCGVALRGVCRLMLGFDADPRDTGSV